MDSHRFDALTRSLAAAGSRRGLLRLVTALPLSGGLAALLGADDAAADGRRRRRKKRHKHGKGRHRGKRNKRKNKKKCKPDPIDQTCAGTCGQVENNCKQPVDCEPCECDVCESGCPFTSLQQAIDDAEAGATLRLCAETYGGTITIAKDLTLIGAGEGEDGTILDGEADGPVVTVASGVTVDLEGVRITGGTPRGVVAASPTKARSPSLGAR